jgi:hypothetical protein
VAFAGHTFYEEENAAYAANEEHAVLDAAVEANASHAAGQAT